MFMLKRVLKTHNSQFSFTHNFWFKIVHLCINIKEQSVSSINPFTSDISSILNTQVTIFMKISRNLSPNSPNSLELVSGNSLKFLVTKSEEFLLIKSAGEYQEKRWIHSRAKFFKTNSCEFLRRNPKIFSRIPQEYLEIFSAYSHE